MNISNQTFFLYQKCPYWLEFSVAHLPMILPMLLSGTVMVSVMIGGCEAMTCLISSSACCALVWVPRTTTVRLSLPPSIGASSLKLTLAPVRSWIWRNKCQILCQIYFCENTSLPRAGEKKEIYWRKKILGRYTCWTPEELGIFSSKLFC